MERKLTYSLLGLPSEEPTLEVSHEEFAYAGNFRLPDTGKTVVNTDDRLLGIAAFNDERTAGNRGRIRYVSIRRNARGEGLGPRLLRFTGERLADHYASLAMAVNNPIAYEAAYRAGFISTGRETGVSEIVLTYRPDRDPSIEDYRAGFERFAAEDLPDEQRAILDRYATESPPSVVEVPGG